MSLEERKADSRQRIRQALDAAFGVYIGQEPKRGDSWRDWTYGQLYAHLRHEIEEIKRSENAERQYHNCLDVIGEAAILAAHVMLREEEKHRNKPAKI